MALDTRQKSKARYTKGEVAQTVTPSNSLKVSDVPFNLYVGTGGDLKVDTIDGQTITLKNVASGTYLDFIKVNKVYSKGTTASDIIAIH